MVDICLNEFKNLDLTVNVKKSACVRFGKRCKTECTNIYIDGCLIPWSGNVKYLGIVFESGFKLKIDFKLSRANFYRCFNAIYSKVSKASETVVISLIKTKCLPIIMYALEAADLNTSLLRSLDNPMFLAVGRVFKSLDKQTVNNCMYFMNIWPLRYEYLFRKLKFLLKLRKAKNNFLNTLYNSFGSDIFDKLIADLNLTSENNSDIKHSLWQNFANSLK